MYFFSRFLLELLQSVRSNVRQVVYRFDAERSEELLCGTEKQRPSRSIESSEFSDKTVFKQLIDRMIAGNTSDEFSMNGVNTVELSVKYALGGAAIAQNMLHNFKEGEELYRAAMLNNIEDPKTYSNYYKEIQAAVLLETHTDA